MTILIVGTTGQIAAPVFRHLHRDGVPVRSFSRDAARTAATLGPVSAPGTGGPEILEGSFTDPRALDHAFTGVDRVLLSMWPMAPEQQAAQRAVIDAAARAAIAQLVRISVLSAAHGALGAIQRSHAVLDDYLAASGVPHSILRPAVFDSTLVAQTAPSVRATGSWTGSAPAGRIPFIDPTDVSRSALAVLTGPETWHGDRDLTGPELLSYPDVARILAATLGTGVRYEPRPADDLRALLRGQGQPGPAIEVALARDAATEAGENEHLSGHVERLTGRRPAPLAEYLRQHKAAYEVPGLQPAEIPSGPRTPISGREKV
jgi:uncharacterized protein YbjT (DUF2867 family)